MAYEHERIEKKWRAEWAKRSTYRVENDPSKPKYYVLDMFPYPSGAGLHVGHPLGYIASDIVARYKRHCGFNVLHPMGYDSFGLPAEQYAIQTGQHPAKTTEENIARYRQQLDSIALSFDWSREVRTSDPSFYKWTQWIFLQLFDSWYDNAHDKARPIAELIARFEQQGWSDADGCAVTGNEEDEPLASFAAGEWKGFDEKAQRGILMRFRLAYLGEAWVNWCPALGTVLANDEVKDGVSERGGHPVERKRMPQWSMRITKYAQRLLQGLDGLDWSESMKEAQRNWIGRSEGARVTFKVKDHDASIDVFTTRPDTIFGVTFVALAPEHELIESIATTDRRAEVMAYVTQAKNRSERERQTEVKRVSGVFTGAYVEHPFTGEDIPVWVGDYVLGGYGTGAVMAVPGGDQRDWNFATHFKLPIIAITEDADISKAADESKEATIANSEFLSGLKVPDAITRSIKELEKIGAGEGRVNYRLRDAAFGRQRYWGEPIPIYYKDGVPYPLPEGELPLVLPDVDKFLPTVDGEPPLARAKNWHFDPTKAKSPEGARISPPPPGEVGWGYETTTMPGWAGSSWYFLRYMDPHNADRFASPDAIKYWQQVDLYVGGAEHATGHLIYFRFWTKFLFDRGWLPFDEPAKKLVNQGMIQGKSAGVYRLFLDFVYKRQFELRSTDYGPPVIIGSDLHDILSSRIHPDRNRALIVLTEFLKNYNERNPHTPIRPEASIGQPGTLNSGLLVPIECIDPKDEESVLTESLSVHPYALSFRSAEFLNWDGSVRAVRLVEKMSKSRLNVVNPDDIISKYGADTLRLYEMFLGPIEQSKPWDTNGIEGTSRFLKKFWNLFHAAEEGKGGKGGKGGEGGEGGDARFAVDDVEPTKAELKILHATIKKASEDIERMSFNTSVSQFMIAVNELGALKCNKRAVLEPLTVLLAPFAPHIAEEIWEKLGHNTSITTAVWPKWDAQYLVEDSFNYPISFNGKTRMQLEFPTGLSKEEVEAQVLANPEVRQRLEGKAPKKVIVVPKRIVNIVV